MIILSFLATLVFLVLVTIGFQQEDIGPAFIGVLLLALSLTFLALGHLHYTDLHNKTYYKCMHIHTSASEYQGKNLTIFKQMCRAKASLQERTK